MKEEKEKFLDALLEKGLKAIEVLPKIKKEPKKENEVIAKVRRHISKFNHDRFYRLTRGAREDLNILGAMLHKCSVCKSEAGILCRMNNKKSVQPHDERIRAFLNSQLHPINNY